MNVGNGACLGILIGGIIGALAGYVLSVLIVWGPIDSHTDSEAIIFFVPYGLLTKCIGGCVGFPIGASVGATLGELMDRKYGQGRW
jgi:hypothetical protein